MSSKNRDLIITTMLILLSIVVIVIATKFKGDAGVFPIALSCLLIVSCLPLIISSLKNKTQESSTDAPLNYARFFSFSALILGLFIFATIIGFFVVIPLFLFLSMRFLGNIKTATALTITLIFSVIIYLMFVVMLGIPVPQGLLENLL